MFFNEVQENFWKKNPEILSWRRGHIERTRRLGHIQTIGGRTIKIEGLDSGNEWDRLKAERKAVNYLIQGSAADTMKIILIELQKYLHGEAHLIAVVHDEVLMEFKDKGQAETNNMVDLIRNIMCKAVNLTNIPIDCDGGVIADWGCKK